MIPNLKRRFEAQEYLAGTWVSVGHPVVAEVIAGLGFDFLLVDIEHTTISLATLEELVRAVDAASGDTEVVVRVSWNDHVEIKRVLDVGVGGVMIPMVGSSAEAEAVVDAMRYPPEGMRGIASGRAADYGRRFQEYVRTVDDAVLTIVQIETEQGVANVDAVATVDGVDSLFVGPSDLSASLGVSGDWENERVLDAIDRVLEASDVPVGSLAVTDEGIGRWVEQGFDWVISGVDSRSLLAASQSAVEAFERAVARREE